jgi:anaerobic selenocysteine-containing dehydrogenase
LPSRQRAHGKLGASPFSLTGQPNAMGGREVGGLANQLAARTWPSRRRTSTAYAGSGRRRTSRHP